MLLWQLPPGVTDKRSGPNSFLRMWTNGWSWENRLTSATVTPSVISDGQTEAQRSKVLWTIPEIQTAQELGSRLSSEPWARTGSTSHLLKHRHTFRLWPGQVKSWKEVFVYGDFVKNPLDVERFSPHPLSFLNVSHLSRREIVVLANSFVPALIWVLDYNTVGDESVVLSLRVIIHDGFYWQGI